MANPNPGTSALNAAKAAQEKAAAILDKDKLTKADVTKANTLLIEAKTQAQKAADAGVPASKVNVVVNDIKTSATDVKSNATGLGIQITTPKITPAPTPKETPKDTPRATKGSPEQPPAAGTPKPTPKPTKEQPNEVPPERRPGATSAPTPAPTPKPTSTKGPTPTAAPTPKPTSTTKPVPSPSPGPKPTVAGTPAPTVKGTPAPTPPITPAPTVKGTPAPTPTINRDNPNASPTPIPSQPGETPGPSDTPPGGTPPGTPSKTPDKTPGPNQTPPEFSESPTPSPSDTPEPSPSPDGSPEPSPSPSPTPSPTPGPEDDDLWWKILRAKLLAAGMPTNTVDRSKTFFKTILTDYNMGYNGTDFASSDALDIVVDQFFYTKDYISKRTGEKFTSPYYEDFGKFNDELSKLGVERPLLPQDLVPLVLGYRDLGKKYNISNKYYDDSAITQYLKNEVSIAEFDDRLNTASLKAVMADPYYTEALKKMGYISDPSQLTDFFLDPKVGVKEMENRQKGAAFVTEAVRRSTPATGLSVDLEFAKQQSARYAAQGYTEAQIATLAATGYENIAEALPTTSKLAGIYERPTAVKAATLTQDIQSELQQEEFMNLASARRKKLKAQEEAAFQGASGIARARLTTAGLI